MKKFFLLFVLAGFSHLSNGQEKEIVSGDSSDTAIASKIEVLEQRLNQQDVLMENLKKENGFIKRQLQQMRSQSFNNRTQNRVSINRRGSKQVITN